MRLAHYKGTRLGGEERAAPETRCSRACISFAFVCFFPSKNLAWMISTDIHIIFFICLWIFNTSKQMYVVKSAGGPKDWGFEPWLASWISPPPTEDHIHLVRLIPNRKGGNPGDLKVFFYQETTRWPDIGQPLIWGDIFFSFLQPRIGTTARWSTHWSALDTSTTCPWIASPQNSVAEGIAWTGLR